MTKLDKVTQVIADHEQHSITPDSAKGTLEKLGGFGFVETVVDGMANMNPERKARKQIFLTDSSKKVEREDLLKNIKLWLELLESNQTTEELISQCKQKSTDAVLSLKTNLKQLLNQSRELEVSYRTLAQFYKNTELDKVDNVSVINASMDQITDLDNPVFINHISEEFKLYYDRLDLRDNYSLLSIPDIWVPIV